MPQALHDLYCQPYLADTNQPSLADSSEEDPFHLSDLFNKAAKFIHDRHGYDPSHIQGTPIEELINSIHSVLKRPLTNYTIKHRIPEDLKQTLERNIFFFSGFKTHHQMEEVSSLLRGEDGGFKPFSQFLQDVKQINRVYNSNYQRAEYKLAYKPGSSQCHSCTQINDCWLNYMKTENEKLRTHYKEKLKQLYVERIEKETDNGTINIRFTKEGNKHLINDAIRYEKKTNSTT